MSKEEIAARIRAKKSPVNKEKFIIYTAFGEVLDVAMHLKFVEGHEVLMYVSNPDYRKIGDGIIDKVTSWFDKLGEGYIWLVDGCEDGRFQDWLREQGEFVFGSSQEGGELEDNRQKGQALFERMGLIQPYSENFKSIDDALDFVKENPERKFILKQNADAPKSLNHKTKFDGAEDMIYHLEQLKKKWNEAEFGSFDCDLMEQVEGQEMAVSAFFNGTDFIRNAAGEIASFINIEHKKESNGDLGATTGETGTVFFNAPGHELVDYLLTNEELIKTLRETKFRGVFDINGSLTKEGYVGFEPTMRPGIPSSSWEFLSGAGLESSTGAMLAMVARGESGTVEIYEGIGIVLVVTAKPFPVEANLPPEATSLGEKLWIIKDGEVQKDFDLEQRLHIHLENFWKDEDYLVATGNGYLLTVTMRGETVKDAREKAMEYVKENLFISDMKYRTDIGSNVEHLTF